MDERFPVNPLRATDCESSVASDISIGPPIEWVGWSSRREHWRGARGGGGAAERSKLELRGMDGEGEEGGGAVVEGAAEHQK